MTTSEPKSYSDPNLSSFLWSVADLLRGIRDILLNHSDLYETLRAQQTQTPTA